MYFLKNLIFEIINSESLRLSFIDLLLIVFPLVEKGKIENKMELISPQNIKETLSVKAGDDLQVEILSAYAQDHAWVL